jgi:hypothetical protein
MNSSHPNDRRHEDQDDDLAPEYDFSGGVRGKHALSMREGYTIIIQKADGTREVRQVTPRPGTIVLDPDVRAYFPDSEAVNRALRELIKLLPQRPASSETR